MLSVGKKCLFGLLASGFLGLLSGCDNKDACKTVPECAKQGKCTVDQSGACKVGSDQDCRDHEPCKMHGKCTAKDGACTAQTDGDCKNSDECKSNQLCSVYNGNCVDLSRSIHPE